MSSHVDFLGVLFIIWGVLTALIGVSTLALGVGAVAILMARQPGGGVVAAELTAAVFTALAFIAMLWGAAHAVAGVALRRRLHWARLVALLLGSIDLLLLPIGTALGCYALWVLLSEESKRLFETAGVVG